jgi:CRP/FNR family nitrogen fixation transcriptional regulator
MNIDSNPSIFRHSSIEPERGRLDMGDAEFSGQRQAFAKGQDLFGEGDPAEFFYRIVYGSVGSSKLLSDARRQIDSFHLAGDIFGYECAEAHSVTVTALEDTKVVVFPRSRFRDLMQGDPALAEQLVSAMSANLQRAREHMLLLARKTPQEKLAMFLLDLAVRLKNNKRITLPMYRADIADHLGLTKETVSRTMTQMARDGLIGLEAIGRTIRLTDPARLRELNG